MKKLYILGLVFLLLFSVGVSAFPIQYNYTGDIQVLNITQSGLYEFNLSGAKGGAGAANQQGGAGGTTYGRVNLNIGDVVYLYVGGMGYSISNVYYGGWNGGGDAGSYLSTPSYTGGGGGGGTDIRVNGQEFSNRVLVAGGGGGGQGRYTDKPAGAGGGASGGSASGSTGGTQISGGSVGGSLGIGGTFSDGRYSGGGGGYYGGGASAMYSGASGGSGYIGGTINYSVINGVTTLGSNNNDGYIIVSYIINSLTINIYDEVTGNVISGDFNLTMRSDSQSTEVIQSGKMYQNLNEGIYYLTLSNSNYTSRDYVVEIKEGDYKTLNAYMTTSTTDVDFYIKDSSGNNLDGAVLDVERSINNTWTLVSSMSSDISGQLRFYYDTSATYRLTASKQNYEDKTFILSPIKNSLYNVYLTPLQKYDVNQSMLGVGINYYVNPYTLNNVTLISGKFTENQLNNFTFVISSPMGYLVDYGYNLSFKTTSISSSGSNSYGSSFNGVLNITESSLLDKVYLTYYYNSSTYGYYEFSQEFYINQELSKGHIANLNNERYGLGMLERVLIVIIVAAIFGGLIGLLNGALAGGVAIIFIFGYFLYSGFLEIYLVALPIALILFYILRGGD